ncbi:MAG: GNAT family N-acetyltransferase [Acidobacteria bacterium]|nr:GNAT family N-acetyltransferase [Acidobacteriota bacterium]
MVTIRATSAVDVAEIRVLFEEYAQSLGIDLGFQDFENELASLPGVYSPPSGCLLLAANNMRSVGCIGVRQLDTYVCEMKRLYVRPDARGHGLGRRLAAAAIAFGQTAGYHAMRLDTLSTMAAARELYRQLGFRDVAPYRYNPIPETAFMELIFNDPPNQRMEPTRP